MSIEISAPGKLILCGEHSVVYGKKALACSIDLRTRLVSSNSSNQSVFELNLVDLNKIVSFTSDEFDEIVINGSSSGSSSRYDDDIHKRAVGLLVSMIRDIKWSHLAGRRVQIKTEIPLGAGLGSSASFSTCLSAYFLIISGVIQIDSDQNLKDGYLLMINDLSYEIEKLFHGRPSGIDNSVACFGGAVVFENGKVVEKIKSESLADAAINVLIINSGREKQTQAQVKRVGQLNQAHPNSVEFIMNAIDEISSEFIRVIKSGGGSIDYECLDELVTMNQGLLHSLHVNNAELNSIVSWAQRNGLSAKITGSGGGGCCYALLRPNDDRVLAYNQDGGHSYRVKLGCDGVRIDNYSF